jgi:hypothetical protein
LQKTAIIYIPADRVNVSPLAQQCLEHCERRGYKLHTIFRHWAYVDWALGTGAATVVVLPSAVAEHRAGGRPPGPDDENTCRLPNRARLFDRNVPRGVYTPRLSEAQMREVLDGNRLPPAGFDPETVAAARRIARHLNGER